jgi:hypothetical protein
MKTQMPECIFSQTTSKVFLKTFLVLCLLIVVNCGSSPQKKPESQISPFTFVDSTLYFAERTASVSMRATFNNAQPSGMNKGYMFQFRTISKNPAFLNSVSIVAGGKRFFLEEGQIVLPSQKGVTLKLPLNDSLFVAKYPSALLQFRYNNTSFIFSIELHQLKDFEP